MKDPNNSSHIRRAQIVSLSLTELMLLLVFMAVAFSFLAKKEDLKEIPRIQAQLNDALKENARLNQENNDLTTKLAVANQDLDRLNRFLERIHVDSSTLTPTGDSISIDPTHIYVRSTTGGAAPGHPQCALKNVYLLRLELLSNMRIQGAPNWDSQVDSAVATLPGVSVLTSGKELTLAEFGAAAKMLFAESLRTSGCVFAVKATRETEDADAFDAELLLVERYFDVSHR